MLSLWRARIVGPALALVVCECLAVTLATAQGATTAPKPSDKARTSWGDPDLQGIWTNSSSYAPFLREQQRPEPNPERPRQASTGAAPEHWYELGERTSRTTFIVDPADGFVPPLTPWAKQRTDSMRGRPSNGPEDFSFYDRCITKGIPGGMIPHNYDNGYQIVQTPTFVAILYQMIHEARIIPLAAAPPPPIRQWNGISRGRWEGATLVVEVTNYTDQTSIEYPRPGTAGGALHSEQLHVTERFTRIDDGTIDYRFTVNDPKTWTKPWTVAIPLKRDPKYRLFEYACHEGNYAMSNSLSGARAEEKAAAAKK
jgi:hypothetical protein